MTSHRPFLSVFSVVCLCGGLTFCIYTKMQSKKNIEFRRRLNARRVLRRRERASEQQRRRQLEEQDGSENEGSSQDEEEIEEETDKNK